MIRKKSWSQTPNYILTCSETPARHRALSPSNLWLSKVVLWAPHAAEEILRAPQAAEATLFSQSGKGRMRRIYNLKWRSRTCGFIVI